ncbi:CDP-diacylglycerol diphosphatase [Mycobacterium spongiae]|uniref:CDP-diacylglycerol diphosphatase n=1 Tax=Mycobacterium spongiae TaxID=886343 RepID=UPI001FE3C15C|nr:CDP-diacylglycerol diphosphatase [Mycobacterium spongiae]
MNAEGFAPASRRPRLLALLILVAAVVGSLSVGGLGWAHADPDALWRIVHDQCVPHQQQTGDPAPCALVDLHAGEDKGYAVYKDIDGPTQFLLIPTARITGIESPALLAPDATNYFAAAWRARTFVEQRAGHPVPRDWMSLAVNSEVGRTQDQLHVHIDRLGPDVHEALRLHAAEMGPAWKPFPIPLAGHRYSAMVVTGDNLDVNPFALAADGVPGARHDMGLETLVVVGAVLAGGQPGFTILAGHADPSTGDTGSGEELQDHNW